MSTITRHEGTELRTRRVAVTPSQSPTLIPQTHRYDGLLGCAGGTSLVVLKVTYPNCRVTVDDKPVDTFMVSPGFIGFEMPAGMHIVTAQYVSTSIKTPLVALGLLTAIGLVVFRRRLVRPPWSW